MLKSRKVCGPSSVETFDSPVDLNPFETSKARRHPKSLKNCSRREKEIKVLGSVSKELAGKSFQNDLKKFQPSGALMKKQVICQSDKVSLRFSSPLSGIAYPYYIKKWKCEGMTEEEQDPNATDEQRPSVIAVKLNWRRGVKVKQISQYSRRTKNIDPEMTTTDFDFESKIKFQKQFQAVCVDLFPDNDLRVLDGNECHGRIVIKSKDIKEDKEDSEEPDHSNVQHIYDDQEEHKILLVPVHSKGGFDSDVTKRYSFPYNAKFTINKKIYESHFQLRLVPSESPQHFGLVFTFPGNGQGDSITIKSLLTVYSVFPKSPKYAYLVTYSNEESHPKKDGKPFVKNLTSTVTSNLKEGKMVSGSAFGMWDRNGDYSIGCEIAHPNQRFLGLNRPRPFSLDQADTKHKEKVQIIQNIKAESKADGLR